MAGRLRGLWHTAPATLALASACVAVFAAQRTMAGTEFLLGRAFLEPFLYLFGIHPPLLFSEGFFWQPLTYAFLHGSWFHLAVNLLGLMLFGFSLEGEFGTRRFRALFFTSAMLGGLLWAAGNGLWHLRTGDPCGTCVGASGGVYGLVGAYAALYANRKLYVLIAFVPLRLRGKSLAIVILLLTVLDAALDFTGTAYAAHFVGFVAGWLLGRRWRNLGFGEANAF